MSSLLQKITMLPKKRKFTASDYENFESTDGSAAVGTESSNSGPAAAASSSSPATLAEGRASSGAAGDDESRASHSRLPSASASSDYGRDACPASPQSMVVDLSTPKLAPGDTHPTSAAADLSTTPRQHPQHYYGLPQASSQRQGFHRMSPSPSPHHPQQQQQQSATLKNRPPTASPSSTTSSRNNTPVFGSSGVHIRRLSSSGYHDDSAYYSGGAKYGSPIDRKSPAYVKREMQPSPLTTSGQPRAPGTSLPPPPPLVAKSDSAKFDLDLRDWIGQRVLARRDQYYCPGVVKNVYEGYSLSILFDGEEQPLVYHEILARGELDTVISDSVPASSQVRKNLILTE